MNKSEILSRKRYLLEAMLDYLCSIYELDIFDSVVKDVCLQTLDYFEDLIDFYLVRLNGESYVISDE